MAYQSPLTIKKVVKDISANKYVLPSIQREYVWDTEQIETLFDSLMRGYPIGTFLFWEIEKKHVNDYVFYAFMKNYHELKDRHNKKIDLKGSDGVIAVLDGQQRLTSIFLGLKGTYAYKNKYKSKLNIKSYPERKLYLNLLSKSQDINNEYDFRFLTKDEVKNDEKINWFEVGKILDFNEEGDVLTYIIQNIQYNKNYSYTTEQMTFANNTLAKLFSVINKDGIISYYNEDSTELDKVLNIFIRVNSGGTKLSYSDLLLSIASAQWDKHDAREEIIDFVNEINDIGDGFKFNKDFVLKSALVLSDLPNIAFKVDNFNKSNMQIIEDNWETIKKSIRQAVLLVSSFGYSGETLTSNNSLIPIAYYLMCKENPKNYIESGKNLSDKNNIKRWLISTLLKRVFSGQSDNVLNQIRDIIKYNHDEFPLEKIQDKFKGSNKSIIFTEDDIDEFLLNLKYGKADTLSTLMLLYPSLDFNNKFHIDHIYPKSKFNKRYLIEKGVAEEKIAEYIDSVNDIENLQLLAAQINEEKLNADFDEWFNTHLRSEEMKNNYRTVNFLPDMKYDYNNYLIFIEKRRKLIKNKLYEILLKVKN